MALVLYLKSHCHAQGYLGFPVCYLLVVNFTFQSMIHFELIFVKGIRPMVRITFFFFFGIWVSICSLRKGMFLLDCIAFVKDQLTRFMWVYF